MFVDPFPQDLESLFSEEDAVSAEFSSKDTTTLEAVNAPVETTEGSMLVEDTRALLADIGGQFSAFGQGSEQENQAEVLVSVENSGPVEASVLAMN